MIPSPTLGNLRKTLICKHSSKNLIPVKVYFLVQFLVEILDNVFEIL